MASSPEITVGDVDSVVAWTLIRTARRAARLLTLALTPHELTPVEFGVLAQLGAARGELTQAEVARAVEIRPQSVAPVIDALTDRGLLLREGTRGRGRSGRLLLSADGAALLRVALADVQLTNDAFADQVARVHTVNKTLLHFLREDQHGVRE